MHEMPTTSDVPPSPSRPVAALDSLRLLERLVIDCGLSFDRARVRSIVNDASLGTADLPERRLSELKAVLAMVGIQGRVKSLALPDALDASRQGVLLVGPLFGRSYNDAWIYVRSAGLTRARLAADSGADIWASQNQIQELLSVDAEETIRPWLVVEPAFPCASYAEGVPVSAGIHGSHEARDGHHRHLSPTKRLIALLRPEARDIWVVTIFSAIVSLLALATPITVEALVNTVAFGRFLQPVIVLSLVLLGFLGFAAAIRILQAYVAEIIQRRLFVRVVADLSQRLPRVKQEVYEGSHGPELLNRFFDVMTVQKSAALLVLDGIAIVLQSAVGMAVLAFYHPVFLGFDVMLLVALAFVVFALGRGGIATSIEESKAKYAVAAWLEQLALCPLTFKNIGGTDQAVEHADHLAIEYIRARERHFQILIRQVAFTLLLQAAAAASLLGIGGWLVIQGKVTLGQLVAAELIVALIVGSFAKLGKHMETYYDLLAAVDKLGHLFDLPMENAGGERLREVSPGLSVELGEHSINSGEMAAIVGPPGSGKSTLLAAAFGLRNEHGPPARIDGIDTRSLDLATLRSQVALVRNCEIFAGSLAENVHLNRPGTTSAEVRTCLKEIGLGPTLNRLPGGLSTALQPGGIPLTDGQARCVVLARALCSRPRLLLIDGLFDGLPDELLPEVMDSLEQRTSQMTIVIATGRNDIARYCTRVLTVPSASHVGDVPFGSDTELRLPH